MRQPIGCRGNRAHAGLGRSVKGPNGAETRPLERGLAKQSGVRFRVVCARADIYLGVAGQLNRSERAGYDRRDVPLRAYLSI